MEKTGTFMEETPPISPQWARVAGVVAAPWQPRSRSASTVSSRPHPAPEAPVTHRAPDRQNRFLKQTNTDKHVCGCVRRMSSRGPAAWGGGGGWRGSCSSCWSSTLLGEGGGRDGVGDERSQVANGDELN